MAKKAKRDFDLDAVLSAIEIINGGDLLEDPIMVDDDDADNDEADDCDNLFHYGYPFY